MSDELPQKVERIKLFKRNEDFEHDEDFYIYTFAQFICGANPDISEEVAIDAINRRSGDDDDFGICPEDAWLAAAEATMRSMSSTETSEKLQ